MYIFIISYICTSKECKFWFCLCDFKKWWWFKENCLNLFYSKICNHLNLFKSKYRTRFSECYYKKWTTTAVAALVKYAIFLVVFTMGIDTSHAILNLNTRAHNHFLNQLNYNATFKIADLIKCSNLNYLKSTL